MDNAWDFWCSLIYLGTSWKLFEPSYIIEKVKHCLHVVNPRNVEKYLLIPEWSFKVKIMYLVI